MAYEGEIRIRVFGNKSCDKCSTVTKMFSSAGIAYEFFDADADQNEKLCDNEEVDELPHIQAYHVESGKVIFNHKGVISPVDLTLKIQTSLEGSNNNVVLKGKKSLDNNGGCCGG